MTIEDVTQEKLREGILHKKVNTLKAGLKERYRFGDIIGKSTCMQQVYDLILQAAESDAHLLIRGESGTGKELIAKTLYQLSARSKHRFVTVNCGAIAPPLFEREMFGHRKGAFTGATCNSDGYLEAAHQGVLFLDEVGELALEQQVKLLRVLQDGEYTPLGTNTPRRVDVRIITATHRDLEKLVETEAMREDFFYRLHIIEIVLPPLRERKDDIPLLIEHLLNRENPTTPQTVFPVELLEQAYAYDWPGNVRELRHALRRYTVTGKLIFADLARNAKSSDSQRVSPEKALISQTWHEAVGIFENDFLRRMLDAHNGNRTKTAATLKIKLRTLQRYLKKHQIS